MKAGEITNTFSVESISITEESNWIQTKTVIWFIAFVGSISFLSFIWFVSFVWFLVEETNQMNQINRTNQTNGLLMPVG